MDGHSEAAALDAVVREIPKINGDVVEALRDALARAERGEAVAVAMFLYEGAQARRLYFAGMSDMDSKVGAMFRLAHELAAAREEE